MTERRYQDVMSFRRALDDRLRQAARQDGAPRLADLRRQFVLECFLARVFAMPGDLWVLKGGTGLAVRLPGARHSLDLDLLAADEFADLDAAVETLVEAGRTDVRDPFSFVVVRRTVLTGEADGIRLTVTARLGPRPFEQFPIDLTRRLAFVGQVETLLKPLPIAIDDVHEPPPMRLYPLVDQASDKVAAMYEVRRGRPSSRFRDLVDLVIICGQADLDPELLGRALRMQQRVRGMELPAAMTSPGTGWTGGYASAAGGTGLPVELRRLGAALRFVGRVLDPVLGRLDRERG